MGGYLIRRFLLMLLTLFGISVLIFVMLRLVPGNIADIVFNAAGMIDVAEKAKLEKELGLDQPIAVHLFGRFRFTSRLPNRISGLCQFKPVVQVRAHQSVIPAKAGMTASWHHSAP